MARSAGYSVEGHPQCARCREDVCLDENMATSELLGLESAYMQQMSNNSMSIWDRQDEKLVSMGSFCYRGSTSAVS